MENNLEQFKHNCTNSEDREILLITDGQTGEVMCSLCGQVLSDKIVEFNGSGFVTSNTNLRSGAGVNFSAILTLPRGTEVQIRGKVEGRNWYLIKLTSKSDQKNINLKGYVDGKLLAHLK